MDCQAPAWPTPQPTQESTVSAPAMVTAPLNLLVPKTPRVVEGTLVPMPTLFSLALTTKVLLVESTIKPERKVEVAVAELTMRNKVAGVVSSEMKLIKLPV